MYWLTAIALLAAFFLWAFSPDVAGAVWATLSTLAACWLAIDLFE